MFFINEKRLRIYPRIFLIASWLVIAFNLVAHKGWQGATGQIIGTDFITLYSAGLIYRYNIGNLYSLTYQGTVQQSLIQPTQLSGVNPFISPPYVAFAYSLLTYLPLSIAIFLWMGLSLLMVIFIERWAMRLLPDWLKTRINNLQLSIILLSFYPFINGWYAGQNHVLTLLLVCGLIYFMLDDRWYLVGIFSGLTIYKPQFIVGFLVIWLVWKKYKAVLTFSLVAMLWIGISIIQHGLLPYTSYLQFNDLILSLPDINGFPGYLMITPYGLLATLLPREARPILESLLTIWVIASTLGLTLLAYQYRRLPMSERTPVVIVALLYPFLATPYALFHDLLLLFPVFILWSRQYQSRILLNLVVVFYLTAFIMPILGYAVKVAFLAIIPIGVLICYLRYLIIDKGLPGKLRVI